MNKRWEAAYYPSDVVEDQRIKTIFCLLFDKVIVHFPIAHMGCGGGVGISDFYADDPLVQAGLIELREEFLLDDIPSNFTEGNPWGTSREFDAYYSLNIAGMAMQCCEKEGAIPVTSKVNFPLPISMLNQLDIKRAANLQASALAIQSINLAFPNFSTLESNEVLDVRGKLENELAPFRSAMAALAPKVRSGLSAGGSIDEVMREAKYIAETDISPRLSDLKRRLSLEKGSFWRRITQKSMSEIPGIVLKCVSSSYLLAAVDSAKVAGGIAGEAIANDILANQLLANGGLGFLIKCEAELKRKSTKPGSV